MFAAGAAIRLSYIQSTFSEPQLFRSAEDKSVIGLFALFQNKSVLKSRTLYGRVKCGHLAVADGYTAVLDKALCLALGRSKSGYGKHRCNGDAAVLKVRIGKCSRGHVLTPARTSKNRSRSFERLVCLIIAVNELGKLVGELFLSGVDGAALELFILCDLIERHKCQHLHALDNVTVTDISPILEELVGRSLFGVEPNSAALGLAHLLALAVG